MVRSDTKYSITAEDQFNQNNNTNQDDIMFNSLYKSITDTNGQCMVVKKYVIVDIMF